MRQYLDLVDAVLSGGSYKPNRTGVDTISSFSQHYEVDLQEGFPLLTTKQMDGYRWNSLLHEVCWYLSGEEHVKNLREETKIWDAWADDAGRLDTAYGRFWRRYPIPEEGARLEGESWPADDHRWVTVEDGAGDEDGDERIGGGDERSGGERNDGDGPRTRRTFDQLQYVIDTLSESPNSRRLVVNAWHPANAAVSTLPPCHFSFVFNVQGDRLNCHLTQRSADTALGVPFNIAAYSLLTTVVAQQTGFEPGSFAHTLVDAHVYCGRGDRGAWYAENLDALQSRLAGVESREEYLEVRDWLENAAPAEPADDDRLDHVPGLLEQLSRRPLDRPTLEVADVPIDDLAFEHVQLRDYDSHDGIRFAVAE